MFKSLGALLMYAPLSSPLTFDEAQLPSFEVVDCSSESGGDAVPASQAVTRSYTQRAVEVILQDIDQARSVREHPDYKYGSKERILASLDLLAAQYGLFSEAVNGRSTALHSNIFLYKTLNSICRAQNIGGYKPPRKIGKSRAPPLEIIWRLSSSIVKPRYLTRIHASAVLREQEDGTATYGESGHPLLSFSAQVDRALQDHAASSRSSKRAADEGTSAESDNIPRKRRQGKPTKASQLQRIRQEARDVITLDDDASTLTEPTSSTASRDLVKKRTRSMVAQSDASVVSAADHKALDQAAQRSDGENDSEAYVVLSASPGLATFEGLDFGEIDNEMQDIALQSRKHAENLLCALNLEGSRSPTALDADACLCELYNHCFGIHWPEVFSHLRQNRCASAVDITTALIGSFMHLHVFSDQPSWQVFFQRAVALPTHLRKHLTAEGMRSAC